jgi:two-component system invasion response regulator UvrY
VDNERLKPNMIEESTITKSIKVVLADDHPVLMTGLSAVLKQYCIEVIGEATTPNEAVQMNTDLKPDVLVLDIRFGKKTTGIDAAKEIITKDSDAKIIFFSQFDQDSLIREAYRIGACSFVMKNCNIVQLANAVKQAYEGKRYFVPEVAERFASWALDGDRSPLARLEKREYEIFMMMARGFSNVEIASKLDITQKTVSIFSQQIKSKLGAERNADLTMLAVRLGLIEP